MILRGWTLNSVLTTANTLVAQYNPSRGELARPPGNSAEGIPDTVSWIIVTAFVGLVYWLYTITQKKQTNDKP